MNLIDWITLAALIGFTISGYIRGLIRQLLSAFSFLIAGFIAFRTYASLVPVIQTYVPFPGFLNSAPYASMISGSNLQAYYYNAISFLLIFIAASLAISIVGHILNWISKAPGLNLLNKLLGALLALAVTAVVLAVLFHVLVFVPNEYLQSLMAHSILANFFLKQVPFLSGQLFSWSGVKSA